MTVGKSENSRAERRALALDISLHFGDSSHKAKTSDVSHSGAAVIADKAIFREVGSSCQVKFEQSDGKLIHVDCHVVRVYANQLALAFKDHKHPNVIEFLAAC